MVLLFKDFNIEILSFLLFLLIIRLFTKSFLDTSNSIGSINDFIDIFDLPNIFLDLFGIKLISYKNALSKIEIICDKHGSFFQSPNKHITLKQGCPKCKRSKGVDKICRILDNYNIKYDNEKSIIGCVSKNNKLLYFDILINNNIAIEYDGEQHFIPIEKWGGEKNLKSIRERDLIKDNFCKENNILIFRISYKDNIEERMKYIISSYL